MVFTTSSKLERSRPKSWAFSGSSQMADSPNISSTSSKRSFLWA
jgi:hypothetical protein